MRERIKQVILEVAAREGIKVEEIILFGSRARGEATERSDWDVLIIIGKKISIEEEKRFFYLITEYLARKGLDCDVLIKTRSQVNYYKEKVGSLIKQALKEGEKLYG